jgi:integrase/recombinase XerD
MSVADSQEFVIDPLVERYLGRLRVEGGLATNTLESYRRDLAKFQHYLAQHRLGMGEPIAPQVVVAFLAMLKRQPLAASSIARILSALRGWFRFLVREQLVESATRSYGEAPVCPVAENVDDGGSRPVAGCADRFRR